jgi:undecaprenyl diphosphate synthase
LLSADNLERNPGEVSAVVDAQITLFSTILQAVAIEWNCKMVHAGVLSSLPSEYVAALKSLCTTELGNHKRTMYLCAGYDPEREILEAADRQRRLGGNLIDHMWVPRRMDIVIRTGGDLRTSNFLPLQSGYAELFFVQKLYPDFDGSDLREVLESFKERRRRFGR